MASIPQSYINSLIEQNEWATLFTGSVVSLVGMNFSANGSGNGHYGDQAYPENFRYLAYTTTNYPPVNGRSDSNVVAKGCVWSSTLNDLSKWILRPFTNSTSGAFMLIPYTDQTTTISWRKGGNYDNQMVSGQQSPSTVGDWERWLPRFMGPATWNGVDYSAMSLGNAFDNPINGICNAYINVSFSLFGLCTSGTINSAQLLQIISPGDALLQKFCSDVTNLSTQVCVNYCSLLPSNCNTVYNSYCVGANLSTQGCIDYCSSKTTNCDIQLTTYCAQLIQSSGLTYPDFLNTPSYADVCGCFLPTDVYSSYASAYQNLTGTPPVGDVKNCYFPFCSSATLHPSDFKNQPACPAVDNCFNIVQINNNGTIDKVSVNQKNTGCKNIDPKDGLPKHKFPTPKKVLHNKTFIIIIISIVSVMAGFFLISASKKGSKKKK